MSVGSKLEFDSNIHYKKTPLKKFLPFCKDTFIDWKTHFS